MTYEDYVERQAAITAALVALALLIIAPFRLLRLGPREWVGLLAALYPHVEQARRRAAELARDFYDNEREHQLGDAERHPVELAGYRPDWFEDAMGAAKPALMHPDATEADVARAVSVAAKEIENAGRKTILRAVETDPKVKGWARVAGGRESCAFCTMLISRGPVYLSADSAGLEADTVSAVALWRQADDAQTPAEQERAEAALDELMTRWHPNCDCKVVPVFNRARWPGRDAYLDAERLWASATKGHSGRDALNALRRALYHGTESDSPSLELAA